MHRLGHWALCAGPPVIVVLYAPFEPLALVMLLLPLYLHYLCLFSHFLLLLPFLQGRCAFASKAAHLRDPELRKLAEGLPLRVAKVTERYSRAFQKFRGWSACFERHGRWRVDRAKDGYIKARLESLLSVSKSLHA